MKYDIIYACGHEGTLDLWGKESEREWKLKKAAEGLCPECEERRLHEEVLQLREQWKAAGLPALEGRDAHMKRASERRDTQIRNAQEWLRIGEERAGDDEKKKHKIELYKRAFDVALRENWDAATWAFDTPNLEALIHETVRKYGEKLMDRYEVVEPETKKTDVIAYVRSRSDVSDTYIEVKSPKDRTVIDILKGIGYIWDQIRYVWTIRISDRDNSEKDALAYVTAKLLAGGVAVNAEIKVICDAIAENYVPRVVRYIWFSSVTKDYRIIFPYGDDCTSTVKDMRARWNGSAYTLPEGAWKKILDLEEIFGFKLSKKTKEHIEELEGVRKVSVTAKEQEKGAGLAAVLESSREVLPDLMDD